MTVQAEKTVLELRPGFVGVIGDAAQPDMTITILPDGGILIEKADEAQTLYMAVGACGNLHVRPL